MKAAPDFTLIDTNRTKVSLKQDVAGEKNIVLFFFPLAFSSVCTQELCSIRDNMKIYESLDATIIGISVDSFFTLKAFKESNNLNFLLLSDFNREVSKKYDVLYEDYYGMKGVAKRAVFVINKEGGVVYNEILEDSGQLPNLSKVQQVLAELD